MEKKAQTHPQLQIEVQVKVFGLYLLMVPFRVGCDEDEVDCEYRRIVVHGS
jgi:hypothetical protein